MHPSCPLVVTAIICVYYPRVSCISRNVHESDGKIAERLPNSLDHSPTWSGMHNHSACLLRRSRSWIAKLKICLLFGEPWCSGVERSKYSEFSNCDKCIFEASIAMESEDHPLLETTLESTPNLQYTKRPGRAHQLKDFLLHYPWISAYIFIIHLLLGLVALVLALKSRLILDPAPFCKLVQTLFLRVDAYSFSASGLALIGKVQTVNHVTNRTYYSQYSGRPNNLNNQAWEDLIRSGLRNPMFGPRIHIHRTLLQCFRL